MSKLIQPAVAAVTGLVATLATVLAFAAPVPDAPAPVTKPVVSRLSVKFKNAKPAKRTVIVKRRKADTTAPKTLKAVVIDEPNLQDGTVSVVTENDEFATVSVGMGTRIARGYQLASLQNIHPGYTLRCVGAWDQDGFQYQATRIALGNSVRDTDVIARVNAACSHINRARKGGGFGQSLVAMVPRTALPQATSISVNTGQSPAPSASPVPASLVPGTTPAPVPTPAPTPAPASPAPINPSTIPPQPDVIPTPPVALPQPAPVP